MIRGFFRLLILSLLENYRMKGYQILKSIRQLTGIKPSMSTIHDILVELENKNLINSIITETNEKYYQITDLGKKALNEIRNKCREKIVNIIKLIFES